MLRRGELPAAEAGRNRQPAPVPGLSRSRRRRCGAGSRSDGPRPGGGLPGVPPAPARGALRAPRRRRAAPAGSLDALSLAKGIAAEQLSSPGKVLGVVAVVACISYWAGRRSAFRLLRLCGRL